MLDIIWLSDIGMFIASTTYGEIYMSHDGINWILNVMIEFDGYTVGLSSICYSQELGKIIICAANGKEGCLYTNTLGSTLYPSISSINLFASGGNPKVKWFAKLNKCIAWVNALTAIPIKYSSDGVSWSNPVTNVSSGTSWQDIDYSPELNMLVAVGNGADNEYTDILSDENTEDFYKNIAEDTLGYGLRDEKIYVDITGH
jgi:hypothetical protein